jgi:hypothetical protein
MGLDKDDIKALIAILQKGLVDDETTTSKPNKTNTTKKSRFKNKKAGTDNSENKFCSMPEKDMHKEDIEFDRAVRKMPPTPRNREFKTIEVICRSCGKKEQVNPILVHDSVDRYKCNKCSVGAG